MKSLRQAMIAAAMFAASPATAEDSPELKFDTMTPTLGFDLAGMNMRTYGFGGKSDEKIILHGGMYDEIVGVACEWTLEGKAKADWVFDGYAQVTYHNCVQGKEPEEWQKYPSRNLGLVAAVDKNRVFSSDGSITEIFSSLSGRGKNEQEITMGNQNRKWAVGERKVCLETNFGDFDPKKAGGMAFTEKGRLDNGCYWFDEKQYHRKLEAAIEPQSSL